MEDVFEDGQPLKKVKVKRRDWKEHWHVDTPEQVLDDKPWENEALQDLEEALTANENGGFKTCSKR